MEWITSLGIGALTGLAVAVPLGAVGLLLVQEGARVGARRAWPAAAGVATADLLYCAAVLVFGTAVSPALRGIAPWPAVISGMTLVALGAWGVRRARRAGEPATETSDAAGSGRRYLGYLGLTIINPATATSFLAVTTGLPFGGSGAGGALAFAAGVTAASLAWQSLLVAAGGVLHRRVGAAARSITVLAGNALIVCLGAVVLVGAVRG
jgi:threonine/homoserine/homoserine lactone efflux protein